MRSRVLVTGANGFVGRALTRLLAERGLEVRAGIRGPTAKPPAAEVVALGDLGGGGPLDDAVKGVSAIVHLANIPQHPGTPERDYQDVNVGGTRRLLDAAVRAGVRRFVYLSSVKAMGEEAPAGDAPLTEEAACRPADAYGRSKLAAEELCRARSREVEICIVRPPVVYGPGMRGNVARLIRTVDRGWPLPLGAATARRSMIFVTNLVDAVHACITTDRAAGETFLVRDSEDLTVREMIQRFARVLDRRALLLPLPIGSLELVGRVLGRADDVRRLTRPFVISSARIERLLGWRPPITVDQAFAETVAAFRASVPALSEA